MSEREAPWSSGECRGLTIRAMVLKREFKSKFHLKTRWKKMDQLMAENITKIIKASKWGKSRQKILKGKMYLLWSGSAQMWASDWKFIHKIKRLNDFVWNFLVERAEFQRKSPCDTLVQLFRPKKPKKKQLQNLKMFPFLLLLV